MIHTIENEYMAVGVNECGCELTSVLRKRDEHEYLWQGDPAVWNGRSPILFPIVGRLKDDRYRLNGRTYTMAKHGFARKNGAWRLLEKDGDCLSMILSENEDTLRQYPYAFDLIVTFRLEDRALNVTHTVVNKNEDAMYFSLGAHPGFRCALGDRLVFDEPETLSTRRIGLADSLLLPESFPLLDGERALEITKDIFEKDALILNGVKSRRVTLEAFGGKAPVVFDMGGSPWLGIWAKPGAPYVCIEPWWGVNDPPEETPDFSKKEGVLMLPPEEIFQCGWTAFFTDAD